MKMRLEIVLLGSLIIGLALGSVKAQEVERPENELLASPLKAKSDQGIFKKLNQLPESVRKSKQFARILHDLELHATPEGTIDIEARIQAFEQSKADLFRDAAVSYKSSGSKLPIFSDAWTNIGPTNTAGCTKALAISPSDGNTIYAGAAGGGVWKTTNGGSAWTALTDNAIPDLAVSSIAIDPSNVSNIYVGTGDPAVSVDALPGSGLYKSTNAGGSWTRIATTTFSKTVNKVLVHPTNTNLVYACSNDGSNRGLFRSTNAGTSFTKVYPAVGNAAAVVWDVVTAQSIAGKLVMYLVEGNTPGGASTECGIYKSIDDGATWVKITTAGLPNGSSFGKSALAIPASDLTKVYCFVATPAGDLLGLYRSTNSGVLFSSVAGVPSTVLNVGSGAQGWYDLYLGVAPGTSPNDTIYIGGVEAYRSFNGGNTWTSYSDYNTHYQVHVDHQCIAIDPTNSRRVWIGNDGGVYRSTNSGQNWSYLSNSMTTMRAYHIGLDNLDFKKTYSGFQDQGFYKTVSGQSPVGVFGGDGFQPIVDPSNSNIFYTEGPFGSLYRTSDGGNNFSNITGSNFESGADWDVPFAMAPKNNQTLFTGRTVLWKTNNSGSSWTSVSPSFNGYIQSIGLSPSNSNTWWIGLGGGKVKLTIDGGTNWNDKSAGIPGITVRSIVCNPTDPDVALIALAASSTNQARVMRTTNAGVSWTNVSGTTGGLLPGVPVNCIALDSINPSSVWYAATDNGIYYTLNAGQKWSVAGSGLGLASCQDVQVHSNKITIRVGTHGRSIWEANVNILPVELTGLTASRTSNGTQLIWRTDSERGNSGFWVQRSYNYQQFVDVMFVVGSGTTNTEHDYSYLDTMKSSGRYTYRLKQVDLDGSEHLSNTVDVAYGSSAKLRLDQNFPNPFLLSSAIGSTRIHFELPDNDIVTMKLYSTEGALINTLLDHSEQSGGEQDVFWNGTDASGSPVASGVYFYTLETASGSRLSNKLIFITK